MLAGHKFHSNVSSLATLLSTPYFLAHNKRINKMDPLQPKKVFIFDIDGTLLHRDINKLNHLPYHFKSNGRFIYLRPNLHHLLFHFPKLTPRANLVLWTSMMRKNAQKIYQYFNQLGFKFDRLYCQENCRPDLSKDLTIVANDYQVGLDNVFLIDDSPNKRVEDQNFIYIQNYDGSSSTDKQIIRVIKNLYQLLEIPFLEQFIEEAEVFNLQNLMMKIKVQKKQDRKQHGAEQKIGQKVKLREQKVVEGGRKEVRFNQNTKVVVFDLSKTLIAKKKQHQKSQEIEFLKNASRIQGNIIYNRPYISCLKTLLDCHSQYDIRLLVWTTMSGKGIPSQCRQVVSNLDVLFEDVICGVSHKESPGKDLTWICQKYGCSLQNTVLVDDSIYKQVHGQNFINVSPFYGDANDVEMIRAAVKIDEFLGCKESCDIKKLAQKYQNELVVAEEHHRRFMLQAKQKNEEESKDQLEAGLKVQSHIKQNSKIRCIVFDINQTLLTRVQEKLEGRLFDARNKHYFIYLRPHLQDLISFLQQHQLLVCLWSTIKSHNCDVFKKLLTEKGLDFKELFAGEHLVGGRKDLNLVAERIGVEIDGIVLVDDSGKKRVEGQNFMHIKSFDPENQQDDTILHLIGQLEKRLCEKGDCKFKSL